MAKVSDDGPMLDQLEKAKKSGRTYKKTPSRKAEISGPPLGQKKNKSTWNPEKSGWYGEGTGINSDFVDYAPRGYYPPRKGDTFVFEEVPDYKQYIPTQKLKEKG